MRAGRRDRVAEGAEHGSGKRSPARGQPDRGYDGIADPHGAVQAVCPAGDAGDTRGIAIELARGDLPELQLDSGVPVFAVQPGSMHQVQQIRAEGDGCRHRRRGQRQAEQGAPDRDGGAPLARIQGEPYARHSG